MEAPAAMPADMCCGNCFKIPPVRKTKGIGGDVLLQGKTDTFAERLFFQDCLIRFELSSYLRTSQVNTT